MKDNVRPRFPKRDFSFDPAVDLQEVEQFGFINLNEAFEKGVVPGSVDLTDESFNGVSNPGTLISRSQDVFDGLRKREYVQTALSKLSAADREKVENAMKRQEVAENTPSEQIS